MLLISLYSNRVQIKSTFYYLKNRFGRQAKIADERKEIEGEEEASCLKPGLIRI